ncbi:hypothetical protein M406DRAFT_259924 [Cryphonectria parasitica EP155]|uniref:Zn(2)-C6 fungal-type domain-containing protein n=1 Tax=Cryphonectria parasitica (strain ATCC 38755 / EP155) TaxID=660469 RepID=A0A9P4Y1I4_CRYP1|nr:uncharacterized protein M406DRAFT_259924 [Cryphonectria parasitica EP155]KAF3765247.1 hypothetical protein M406DRAFT_259924 [Cryphonectria parasitica EP155]
MSSTPRRKIGSRACDGCKIRKVRCSETPPCTRCSSVGIECTFNKLQGIRGPRSLRAKTLAQIQTFQESQRPSQSQNSTGAGSLEGSSAGRGNHSERGRTPVSSLIVRLCLYNHRLFPVWPILSVDNVIARLLRDQADVENFALANAICAAIIAQLKLPFEGRTDDDDPATAASMAAECQNAKASLQGGDGGPIMNLNMLRISFFQHIYHENLSPGGSKSLLFLREALTIAQIMGLQRQSTYASLSAEEQQMRSRILWLLFVTERGVAMLHRLPTILTWQPSFPPVGGLDCEQDKAQILPAFKRLVELFWTLDQGGAFDLIYADSRGDTQGSSRLDYIQHCLQEMAAEEQDSNEVQSADILVTRSWMQTVLWRVSTDPPRTYKQTNHAIQTCRIISDFLSKINRYSKTALEAHGPTIELKIYEMANALTDALSTDLDLLRSSIGITARPVDMLVQLQKLLASSRGGNKTLLTLLCARIAEVERGGPPNLISPAAPLVLEVVETHGDDANDDDNDDDDGSGIASGAVGPPRGRLSYPAYLDTRLNFPAQLPVWPEIRREPSYNVNVDPSMDLEIMFMQLGNGS